MAENTINTRIQLKSDTEANWIKSVLASDNPRGTKTTGTSFKPKKGELIIFSAESSGDILPADRNDPLPFCRLKVGDNDTDVLSLPFIGADNVNSIVIEKNRSSFPNIGNNNLLYMDISTLSIWQWQTNAYVKIYDFQETVIDYKVATFDNINSIYTVNENFTASSGEIIIVQFSATNSVSNIKLKFNNEQQGHDIYYQNTNIDTNRLLANTCYLLRYTTISNNNVWQIVGELNQPLSGMLLTNGSNSMSADLGFTNTLSTDRFINFWSGSASIIADQNVLNSYRIGAVAAVAATTNTSAVPAHIVIQKGTSREENDSTNYYWTDLLRIDNNSTITATTFNGTASSAVSAQKAYFNETYVLNNYDIACYLSDGTFNSIDNASGALYSDGTNKPQFGTLPVGQGGTGTTSFTNNELLVGSGSSAISTIAKNSANEASTIVERDSSGNFATNLITLISGLNTKYTVSDSTTTQNLLTIDNNHVGTFYGNLEANNLSANIGELNMTKSANSNSVLPSIKWYKKAASHPGKLIGEIAWLSKTEGLISAEIGSFKNYNTSGYYEEYTLPIVTNVSTNESYKFLTTKSLVSVEEGGTGVSALVDIRATKDGEGSIGNVIHTTYLKLSGGSMTGTLDINNKIILKCFNTYTPTAQEINTTASADNHNIQLTYTNNTYDTPTIDTTETTVNGETDWSYTITRPDLTNTPYTITFYKIDAETQETIYPTNGATIHIKYTYQVPRKDYWIQLGTDSGNNATHGNYSAMFGDTNTASAPYSFAQGQHLTANHRSQHIFGEYNIADDSSNASDARGNYVEIVGNGTSTTASNARTLDWNGNEVLAGGLTLGTPLSVANGGTGNTSYTANRLLWTASTTQIIAANHYVDDTKIAINSIDTPTYNLYVNGTSYLGNNTKVNGNLSIFPTNGGYREGIRIHAYDTWSDIVLCGSDNTGDTGTSANSWFIGNNNGNFYISRNGSTSGTSWFGCVGNVWKIYGNQSNSKSKSQSILHIYGTGVGNTDSEMVSGVAGVFSWGDGGPQITFDTSSTPGEGQAGALIWTDHDAAGAGVSWHFVSNQSDWNVTSKRFHARTSISIGQNLPNTSYNLYVNGTSYLNGNATINGNTTINGNLSFSDSGTSFRGINYGVMGTNDMWRVGGAATSTNNGYLEIATGNDGTEPIYVRQYTGTFSSLTRTLTLLDGSGNTSIPGNLYGPNFTTNIVVSLPETASFSAGWRRVCKVSSRYNYSNFFIEVTGGWSNGAPTCALVAVSTRHTSADMTLINQGFPGITEQLRLVNVSGDIFWLDAYFPAQSATASTQRLMIYGNVTVSEMQNSNAIYSESVTAAATIDLKASAAGIYYRGSQAKIRMIRFLDNTSDIYGNGISIGGGGATIIGGGESADTAAAQVSAGNEIMYICNDGDVNIFSNMQDGWGSRKTFTFGSNGTLTATTFSGELSGNASTATMPLGFSSRGTGATWGNTTGTSFTTWNDSTGGSIDFRQDNPSSGKMSIKVDGRFYGNEGKNPACLMNYNNSYWGLGSDPDGGYSGWVRAPASGILTSAKTASTQGSGSGSIGAIEWRFASVYADRLYGNATNVVGTVAIGNGGTGATTAAGALSNLGIKYKTVTGTTSSSTGHLDLGLSGTRYQVISAMCSTQVKAVLPYYSTTGSGWYVVVRSTDDLRALTSTSVTVKVAYIDFGSNI